MHRWMPLPALIVLLGGFTSQLFAQHTIADWPDNKRGAVSITFDDGLPSHLSTAIPALNAAGMKGTFFVITDTVTAGNKWDSWRDVAAMGHEIGSHTKSHAALPYVSADQVQKELSESKAIIDEQIPFQQCLSFAYPYGLQSPDVEAAAAKFYIAARNVYGGLNSGSIYFMSINGYGDDINPLASMKALADYAESKGSWHVSFFHSLDGTGYSFYNLSKFNEYLNYLAGKSLWVATISEAVKFIKEKDSAKLSVVSSTNFLVILKLTDSLDNDIYDQPLTIRSEVPASWPEVIIVQGINRAIKAPVVENGIPVVYYQAMPDQGVIALVPASTWQKPLQ